MRKFLVVLVWAGVLIGSYVFIVTIAEWHRAYNKLGPLDSMRGAALKVIDGDTIAIPVRLVGVDAPELHGKCPSEIELAKRAKAFTANFLRTREVMIVTDVQDKMGNPQRFDRYGRLLARIVGIPGGDLGTALVKAGLAREWTGRREPWC